MERVTKNRKLFVGAAFVAILLALGAGQALLDQTAAQTKQAPRFEVDPFWPKPLPNNWVHGMTIGIGISADDHVWVIHRGNDPGNLDRTELAVVKEGAPPVGECCNPAPPVLEFDQAGNLVGSWGGPSKDGKYDWPESNHGIVVDHKGFVWIGGNGGPDAHILKFTRDGKFVAQYGKKNARLKEGGAPGGKPNFVANSLDMNNFGRVAKIFIDPKANEGYVADGYFNHRVAVIDLDSGKIKRIWGAYGNPPTDENLGPYDPSQPPAKQFRTPVHCAERANDGMVYVYDRGAGDLVYSGRILQGERVEVEAMEDRVTLNGRTVMDKQIRDNNEIRVFFRGQPRPVDVDTAGSRTNVQRRDAGDTEIRVQPRQSDEAEIRVKPGTTDSKITVEPGDEGSKVIIEGDRK